MRNFLSKLLTSTRCCCLYKLHIGLRFNAVVVFCNSEVLDLKMKFHLFLVILKTVYALVYGRRTIRSSWGAPVGDQSNSISLGPRGPMLLQDTFLLDELGSFDNERIPERVIYSRGAGGFGHFEVTNDITRYTKAKVFSKIGKRTPILVRFSLAFADKASAETSRDVRGFAIKFYTEEGNWDVVGNNIPVFCIRDPIRHPSVAHAWKRNPVTNLPDKNAFWDFFTLLPEATHMVTHVFTDKAIPDGYRHMNGYSVNTYKLVNKKGEIVYCRFQYETNQGIKNLSEERAKEFRSSEPDYATKDLYDAIKARRFPSWTFYIQVMTPKQAETWSFNPFDVTKIWPEEEFPLIKVGRLVINKLPRNFFADIEQAAFSPSSLIPGIEATPDKILQGRLFAYTDAQKYRLGANFRQFPINYPYRSPPLNYQRDGPQTVTDNQDGEINYFPNSYFGPQPIPSYRESCFTTTGEVCRWNSTYEDNFTQTGILYRKVLKEEERKRLVNNIVHDLCNVEEFIQERAIKNFGQADPEFGQCIREGLFLLKKK